MLFHTKSDIIITTTNETCYLISSRQISAKISERFKIPCLGERSIMELFVYGFAIPIALLIPAFAVAPFALPNMPFQIVFGDSLPVKLISVLLYGVAVTHVF